MKEMHYIRGYLSRILPQQNELYHFNES